MRAPLCDPFVVASSLSDLCLFTICEDPNEAGRFSDAMLAISGVKGAFASMRAVQQAFRQTLSSSVYSWARAMLCVNSCSHQMSIRSKSRKAQIRCAEKARLHMLHLHIAVTSFASDLETGNTLGRKCMFAVRGSQMKLSV